MDINMCLCQLHLERKEQHRVSIHGWSDHEPMTRWALLMDGVGSAAYEMRQYPPIHCIVYNNYTTTPIQHLYNNYTTTIQHQYIL